MWVFLNNAMLSAVQHRDDKNKIMVRARLRGDLERVFPDHWDQVEETEQADYRFRVTVTRARLRRAMKEAVDSIDYPNFKNSTNTATRHDIYLDVWSVMLGAQRKYANRPVGWV